LAEKIKAFSKILRRGKQVMFHPYEFGRYFAKELRVRYRVGRLTETTIEVTLNYAVIDEASGNILKNIRTYHPSQTEIAVKNHIIHQLAKYLPLWYYKDHEIIVKWNI
jgi:hypothetical protein